MPGGRVSRKLVVLGLLGGMTPSLLQAQESAPPRPEPAPSARNTPADSDENEVEAIIVSGARPRGAALGDIPPEETFSAADVRTFGVSSMNDLLAELSPQTTSGGGGPPVVLLNGRRISSFAEIRDIPTEAIQRVEILPEEVALKYGYSAEQKVVNVVLRQRFRARTVEASLAAPTAGGQATQRANGNSLRLNRDGRVNLAIKYQHSDALLESDRDLTSSGVGGLYDLTGNVASLASDRQIDPALSALAGVPVTVAGVPASASSGPPDLAAFLPTANQARISDLTDSRTLLPKTQQVSVNAVVNRTIGKVAATFNASAEASESTALRGPARTRLIIPTDNPFSPFGRDVVLYRYLGELGPLEQNSRDATGHLGFTLDSGFKAWRWSVTGNYDHAVDRTLTDRGVDAGGLQARLDADDPAFNPFAPVSALPFLTDRARSTTDTGALQLVANGAALRLPAGDLSATIKLGGEATRLDAVSRRSGVETSSDLARDNINAQVSLDLPITSRRNDVLASVGDLSANLNLTLRHLSDFGDLTTIGYGLNWSPVKPLSLIASMTWQDNAPTIQQLGNPLVTTPDARVFDFVRGETVDVIRLSGGNRDLKAEERRTLKLGATLRPPSVNGLSLSANYFRTRTDNPIAGFPSATAAVEAAFPDRFTRDAEGDLLRIDTRSVNFARRESEQLRWGINFSRRIGKVPPRPAPGSWRGRRPGQSSGADRDPATPRTEGQPPGAELLQGALRPDASDRPPQGDVGAQTPPGAAGDGGRADQRQGGDGFGPPGGFGGPGGGPGGGFRGAGAARLQLAVYHTVHLRERVQIAEGLPALDLLNGDAIGSNGGQPRHEIEAQAGITKNGLGARLSATWREGTAATGGTTGAPTELRFSDLATINLRLFADLGVRRELVAAHPFLRGTRLSLSITNLADSQMTVRDRDGVTPVNYQPDYLDPLGRSIQFTVRKLLF